MPAFPQDAFRYQCQVCERLFPHNNAFLNHKRGTNNPCKGSSPLLVLPEDLLEAVTTREPAEYPQGVAEDQFLPEEPGTREPSPQEIDDEGRLVVKAASNGHASSNGLTTPVLAGYVRPSESEQKHAFPVAFYTAFDAMRAHPDYQFQGTFNDWLVQMVDRQLYHMRIKIGISVELPPVAAAEVSHG